MAQRVLGFSESLLWNASTEASFNFAGILSLAGFLSDARLNEALNAAQLAFPLLRVVVPNALPLRFEEREGVGPGIRRGTLAWEREAEHEIDSPFGLEGILWRIVRVDDDAPGTTLILVFHHAIIDGMSLPLLVRFLVSFWNASERLVRAPLTTSLESRLPPLSVGGAWSCLRFAVDSAFTRVLPAAKQLRPQGDARFEDRREILIAHAFNENDTRALRCLAHKLGVRMTALLVASLLWQVARTYEPPTPLSFFVPVNLRPLLAQESASDLGLFVSAVQGRLVRRRQDDFAAFVKKVFRRLSSSIEQDDAMASVRLQPLLLGGTDVARRLAPFCQTSVGVTNLGAVDLPSPGDGLAVRSFSFAVAGHISGSLMGVAAVTSGGRLRLNFSFVEPHVSRVLAEELASGVMMHLSTLIAEQSNSSRPHHVK